MESPAPDVLMKPRAIGTERLRQVWQNRQPKVGPVAVGPLIRAFVKDWGLERPSPLAALHSVWGELVGVELSRHSRLEGFRRGTLRVVVDSAAHMSELQTLVRSGLTDRIVERFDQRPISSIRLRLGHHPGRKPTIGGKRLKGKGS